jgi:hypothetical protein
MLRALHIPERFAAAAHDATMQAPNEGSGPVSGPASLPAGPAAARLGEEVLPCQLTGLPPLAARHAKARPPMRGRSGAAGHRAFPQAEQRVTAHRGKDLRHGIPAHPGQEVRPQYAPQDGQLIAGHRIRAGNRSQLRAHRRIS